MNDKIQTLLEEQELALLRADLASSMLENYIIEEILQISEDLDAKAAALDEALREDFNSKSLQTQAMMHGLFNCFSNEGVQT